MRKFSKCEALACAGVYDLMCFSLHRGLREEYRDIERSERLRERKTYQETIRDLVAKRKTPKDEDA